MFQELLTSFGAIEEPRQVGKVDHLLIDVLAITVCAVLAHAETFEDIALYGKHKEKWLRHFLELPNGMDLSRFSSGPGARMLCGFLFESHGAFVSQC